MYSNSAVYRSSLPFCSQSNPPMAVLLAVLVGLVAGIVMMSKLDSLRRCIWRLLRFLSPPTTVWRAGFKSWRDEENVGLAFLPHGCRNCEWWDTHERSEIASRCIRPWTTFILRGRVHEEDAMWMTAGSAAVLRLPWSSGGINLATSSIEFRWLK